MTAYGAPLRPWLTGAAGVALAHGAIIAAILAIGAVDQHRVVEEPVVLIDLPPLSAPASPVVTHSEPQQAPADAAPDTPLPVAAPSVRAPLPREVIAAAPLERPAVAAPAPTISLPAARATVAPAAADSAPSATAGDDPRAKAQEANYFALLSAHLNKRKRYPSEAKKARQQGIVTVRFTVHSDGSVSGATIRKSSGHELLDAATLDLLQRVAPLPKFPKSMTRPSVTLSLPIDYSLQTS